MSQHVTVSKTHFPPHPSSSATSWCALGREAHLTLIYDSRPEQSPSRFNSLTSGGGTLSISCHWYPTLLLLFPCWHQSWKAQKEKEDTGKKVWWDAPSSSFSFKCLSSVMKMRVRKEVLTVSSHFTLEFGIKKNHAQSNLLLGTLVVLQALKLELFLSSCEWSCFILEIHK